MNPKHVTDLELSKQLFETGITKDFESQFYRVENTAIGHKDPAHGKVKHRSDCCIVGGRVTSSGCIKYTPALLLSELMELMPKNVDDRRPGLEWLGGNTSGGWVACYFTDANRYNACSSKCPLEALSSLASYLLREGKFNNNAK